MKPGVRDKLLALGTGCLFTLLLLLAAEGLARLNHSLQWIEPRGLQTSLPTTQADPSWPAIAKSLQLKPVPPDPPATFPPGDGIDTSQEYPDVRFVDRRYAPGQTFRSIYRSQMTGKELFNFVYHIDAYGRRYNPRQTPQPGASEHLLMFGGSFVEGVGVESHETLPAQLDHLLPQHQVYNFGYSGGGLNDTLFDLEHSQLPLKEGVQQEQGLAIYTFVSHHLERVFCRSLCLEPRNFWMLNKPYYKIADGIPQYQGVFREARPLTNIFYAAIARSVLMQDLGIVVPPRFTKSHYQDFVTMLLHLQRLARQHFGSRQLVFFVYPAYENYVPELFAMVEAAGIPVIDMSRYPVWNYVRQHKIPMDGHPTPPVHKIVARALALELKANGLFEKTHYEISQFKP